MKTNDDPNLEFTGSTETQSEFSMNKVSAKEKAKPKDDPPTGNTETQDSTNKKGEGNLILKSPFQLIYVPNSKNQVR